MSKRYLFPIIASIFCLLLVFWKLPLHGQLPFPGHLLVGRFFPFNTVAYPDYPLGVPYKEFISADTIRQTYPWRQLAIDQLKQGQIPWWNPYSFSGTPLLANLQSAPFYPLNLLYWVFPFNSAWILQVLLQPVLATLFTFLFLRSLKLSPLSAFIGGLTFAFSGFMTVWLQLNTVGHAALWLPLLLWSLSKATKHPIYYSLSTLALTSSFLAGHIQTSLYVTLFAIVYLFFLHFQPRPQPTQLPRFHLHFLGPFLVFLSTFLLILPQYLPTFELLRLAPRQQSDPAIFNQFLLPPSHLVTLIAPNFFGNPATNNYWGQDYGEFMAYFGLVGLILVLISFTQKSKTPLHRFFIATFFITLFLSLPHSISRLPLLLRLPLFSSSAPSRILFLTHFSAAILTAFGYQLISHPKSRFPFKLLLFITSTLILLWIITTGSWFSTTDPVATSQWRVASRNLIIPSLLFLFSTPILFLRHRRLPFVYLRLPVLFLLIPLSLLDFSLFSNKYLPFTEPKFIFPSNPLFSKLQQSPDYSRFFGDFTASVTSNTSIPYHLYSPEGYDSLYSSRYGTLLTYAANQGQPSNSIPRSDANLPINQDNFYRQRLQDLLSIKYILHKNDFPHSDFDHDISRFPESDYQLIWQQANFQIYHNLSALPRAYLVSHVIKHNFNQDQQVLDTLFDPKFDPTTSIVIQDHNHVSFPGFTTPKPPAPYSLHIDSYTPHQIDITISTPADQFLVLTDTYYPGWKAYLDGTPLAILPANYIFRTVFVPAGQHQLVFRYQPQLLDFVIK